MIVYLNGENGSAYILLQVYHQLIEWSSLRGAHELCIERYGSALRLHRWSRSEYRSKIWAELYFHTWEGMSPNDTLWPVRQYVLTWFSYL
jgi:hypothetical protein